MDKLIELLQTKYDIPLVDYFKLNEDDKNEIVDIIISHYERHLKSDPTTYIIYLMILHREIEIAIENEEYERVDIMTRTRKKIKELFGSSKVDV